MKIKTDNLETRIVNTGGWELNRILKMIGFNVHRFLANIWLAIALSKRYYFFFFSPDSLSGAINKDRIVKSLFIWNWNSYDGMKNN